MDLKGKTPWDIEQAGAVANVQKLGYRASVIAATGFGKTRVIWKAIIL